MKLSSSGLSSSVTAATRSREGRSPVETSGFGPDLDERDVVVLGLDKHIRALSLAAREIAASRVQQATAQLDEREEQPLSIALEVAGECARPGQGHAPHDASPSGRSASSAIRCASPRDDRVGRFDHHRMLARDKRPKLGVAHRIDSLESLSNPTARINQLQRPLRRFTIHPSKLTQLHSHVWLIQTKRVAVELPQDRPASTDPLLRCDQCGSGSGRSMTFGDVCVLIGNGAATSASVLRSSSLNSTTPKSATN